MAIDPRIPMAGNNALALMPQGNALDAFSRGRQQAQANTIGQQTIQTNRNALGQQTAQSIARGVLDAPDPAAAYPQALQAAQAMGMDVSAFPEQWDEQADMMVRMAAMPEQELTEFERILQSIPENERERALRVRLGLEPKAQGPEKPTDILQEAQALYPGDPAKQREFVENHRMKSGVNVNVDTGERGPKFGPVPQGEMLEEVSPGVWRMKPIPGGPAEREMDQQAEQAEGRQELASRYGNIVIEDIGRVREKVEKSPLTTTGIGGAVLNKVPGTNAYNASQLLDTIKANIGFDRLQQMRDNSPTGGALGAVSEFENRLLQATLGNLEQSQDDEQFLHNLNRMEETYLDIIHGPGNRPEQAAAAEVAPAPHGGPAEKVIDGRRFIKRGGQWFEVTE